METNELTKLHHNARAWAIDPKTSFNAVQLRSDNLSKEDLKHLGYNVGKFLRLQGEVIARFVKHVFEEPFGTTHIRTIVAKLADRNPVKIESRYSRLTRWINCSPTTNDTATSTST